MREILHWRENTPTGSLAKDKQLQLELFGYVEQGLTRSKKFYSLWQKSISSLASTQFKYDKIFFNLIITYYLPYLNRPIDFIIILLLIHIRDDNSLYLENVVSF